MDPDIDYCVFNRSDEVWNSIFSIGLDERLLQWKKDHPRRIPAIKRYFITLTHNPKICSKPEWLDEVIKVLNQSVHTFVSGVIEHMETNVHCHAVVESKYNLDPQRYKAFFKRHPGSGNGKRVEKIRFDNGTNSYIMKENYPETNLEEFEKKYKEYEIFHKKNVC